jgi:hypothetical protein
MEKTISPVMKVIKLTKNITIPIQKGWDSNQTRKNVKKDFE